MAVCVAVVGKENWPVYVACADAESEMQWRVHTALDVAEERLAGGTSVAGGRGGAPDLRDLYLGLLYSTEAHNIYGYVTNTRVKLFAVVGEGGGAGARDTEVRHLLKRLHSLYADALCSPFYKPGDPITSPIFDKKVRSLMAGNS